MTLKVLGAGFGRTGTNSLKLALEMLRYGPCYHMFELAKLPEHVKLWNDAIDSDDMDWDTLFKSYQSTVDWPSAAFLPQLMKKYPQAKVILTLRDPDDWYESASTTIFNAMEQQKSEGKSIDLKQMQARLILEGIFSGRHRDKSHAISVYNEHINNVINTVPEKQLLQFNVIEGWAPLCKFLHVPVPAEPFPKSNDKEEFNKHRPAHLSHSK